MKRVLDVIRFIAALLPLIKAAIREVEEMIPESGRGAEKLALVRELLDDVISALDEAPVTISEIWPVIQRIIDRFVAIFNATGEFTKS